MGYIPKFIHFSNFIPVSYPFGVHWNHNYIIEGAKAIFNTYREDIENGFSITFVVRGTSGAMIAGAMLNEIHNINPDVDTYIIIVRKDNDISAHCDSLKGIDDVGSTRIVVVDDFISTGETINAILETLDIYSKIASHPTNKYDMLCISNGLDKTCLKKNSCIDYKMWKGILSRFKHIVCCPKLELKW